jgi:putative oxidoreductase
MKTMYLVSRLLLGLIFTVFGLNGFLHFIPMPPPTGVAAQFLGALFVSHFLAVVFAAQLAGGILLLVNRYVPLALTILGPVVVNVVLFHLLMEPGGLPLAIVTAALWSLVFGSVRGAFAGIFAARTVTEAGVGRRQPDLVKAA